MQNCVVVVIHMQQNGKVEAERRNRMVQSAKNAEWIDAQVKKITFLVGNKEVLFNMKELPVLPTFSEQALHFLNRLSAQLRQNPKTKDMTDVLSYAFWIRKASLEKEKENHLHWEKRIGRGVAYHIAPSNVPVNFAVSMTSALLAGNACIIRVSNKPFEQVDIICKAIRLLLEDECKELRPYFCIIRYEHDEEVTQLLSDMCDVRIIWGGNRTIHLIRQAELPPRAIEMAFADRYSVAIINADQYLLQDLEKVAKDFYTDTYYSDQNACSSPRLIVWMGERQKEAKELFWSNLDRIVKQQYHLHSIQAIDKLNSFCLLSARCMKEDGTGIRANKKDNYLYRIEIDDLNEDVMQYKDGGGYFFEYSVNSLEEIVPILGKICQTVAVLGIEKEDIQKLVHKFGVRGVDRIVPVGKTMELSFRWDGYDMIETMSRIVDS